MLEPAGGANTDPSSGVAAKKRSLIPTGNYSALRIIVNRQARLRKTHPLPN
ncbi:MAG: hypothetical protein RQM90_12375 [Methanoculleus sp.]